jgi:hypothetical protein
MLVIISILLFLILCALVLIARSITALNNNFVAATSLAKTIASNCSQKLKK